MRKKLLLVHDKMTAWSNLYKAMSLHHQIQEAVWEITTVKYCCCVE